MASQQVRKAPFILASQSPRRRDLLAQAGIEPADIIPADIDETPLPKERPAAYAARVALEKARWVSASRPGAAVLAADTVVACGNRILPKAEEEATARKCLALLSGRRHMVLGGIALVDEKGASVTRVVRTVVAFKRLSASEMDAYIASGEWHGKAGGYAIQGRAAIFVRSLSGSYTNVVGLPLHDVYSLLAGRGLWPSK